MIPAKTILLVGDAVEDRFTLASILCEAGFSVTENSMANALALLSQVKRFGGVVMDLAAGSEETYDFCATLCALTRSPVTVLSSDESPEGALRFLSAGAKYYLFKPYTRDVILDRLGRIFPVQEGPRAESVFAHENPEPNKLDAYISLWNSNRLRKTSSKNASNRHLEAVRQVSGPDGSQKRSPTSRGTSKPATDGHL